jgi:hypothetical protein
MPRKTSEPITVQTEIRPSHVDIPEEQIDNLRRRIATTRWPSKARAQRIHIKPLTWSKESRGPARVVGFALGLEQRIVLGSDGGSD